MNRPAYFSFETCQAAAALLCCIENRTVEYILRIWDTLYFRQSREAKSSRSIRIACGNSYGLFVKEQPSLYHSHRNDGNGWGNIRGPTCETDGLFDFALSLLNGQGLSVSVYKDHVAWGEVDRSLNLLT